MESSHGKLCTGLTDGLCSDNTNSLTYLNSLTGCHVGTVAFCTDSGVGTAGQNGTNLNLLDRLTLLVDTNAENLSRTAGGNHVVTFYDDISVFIGNGIAGETTRNTVF